MTVEYSKGIEDKHTYMLCMKHF